MSHQSWTVRVQIWHHQLAYLHHHALQLRWSLQVPPLMCWSNWLMPMVTITTELAWKWPEVPMPRRWAQSFSTSSRRHASRWRRPRSVLNATGGAVAFDMKNDSKVDGEMLYHSKVSTHPPVLYNDTLKVQWYLVFRNTLLTVMVWNIFLNLAQQSLKKSDPIIPFCGQTHLHSFFKI